MLKSFQAGIVRTGHPVPNILNRLYAPVLAASVLASSLFYSTFASALGLGEISLHSALNQPLNAEIALLETDGLSPEDIVARLASPEAFAKAGVERVFFLNDLRFTPVVRGGRGVIRVVSNKPVTEPYLSFLVQVSRPNGDLLHEYTLLLDPATSPEGVAATRSRNAQRSSSTASSAAAESRMPVAPPPAVQGKHYTVANGDTLNAIAARLQGPGSKVSTSQMADGIRLLNPQVFTQGASSGLKAGQDLLLPDSASLPTAGASAASPAAPQVQPAQVREAAEQMTAAALETQQLAKAVDDLRAQTLDLQDQLVGKDKQIVALRSDLARAQPAAQPVAQSPTLAAAQPVAAPPPAMPVAQPVATPASAEPFLSIPVLLAALLVFLLILAFVYNRRRQQRSPSVAPVIAQDETLIKPAQAAVVPVFEVPVVAPQPIVEPGAAKAPSSKRMAGATPDALDGVSIYIAYGRFSEAIGILRSALEQQPEREDIRIRLLELLAEQGDSAGFALEERAALEHSVSPHAIQEVRDRYPQLKAREAMAATAGVAAVAAGAMSLEKSQPDSVVSPAIDALPDLEPPAITELDETTAAALNPEPFDEFQLNLDELSLDADWDLVDPFDAPPVRNKPAAAPEIDPVFSSDLNQLPEVFELSDEQFLSDFSGADDSVEPLEVIPPSGVDDLSDDFLDSFMSDDSDFDLLDLDEPPLSQINQAQVLIDDGDLESAREILLQVIAESDEEQQRLARELLAGIS
ncbi:peptigoglycan-binding protein LysM [Pseudomonas viridiflava]|uniref:LysM domain-containing protein n=1 Tax=Pseudomonas viridiflava TaxID=33069 RepID=A0A3M5PA41_PSEVI|nr:FimV/HubP family polar landmark protein [Pseudomonas viridiflava]MBA1229105.1 peptigoglycan-binding protein LysM [Pseudomonas viridiflava]RMT81610.1 LysM domain-containing protein [Pseudomonas viridiflava]